MIRFTIPVKTTNPLNGAQGRTRGAVFGKATRRKKERQAARLCLLAAWPQWRPLPIAGTKEGFLPLPITLIRLSAGRLDGDGLQAALKSVRDGIADALGANDGSDAVTWSYAQRKGKRGEYAVEVEIS